MPNMEYLEAIKAHAALTKHERGLKRKLSELYAPVAEAWRLFDLARARYNWLGYRIDTHATSDNSHDSEAELEFHEWAEDMAESRGEEFTPWAHTMGIFRGDMVPDDPNAMPDGAAMYESGGEASSEDEQPDGEPRPPQMSPVEMPQMSPVKTAQTHAPQTHAPQTHAPQTHAPRTHATQTRAPQTYMPQTYMPQIYMPQIYMPQIYMPQTHKPQTHGPKPNPAKNVETPEEEAERERAERNRLRREKYAAESQDPALKLKRSMDRKMQRAAQDPVKAREDRKRYRANEDPEKKKAARRGQYERKKARDAAAKALRESSAAACMSPTPAAQ
jgi:hypothetical protein